MTETTARQAQLRARLYAAHGQTLDCYWDDTGRFIYASDPNAHGGYRAVLWHCLSYLSGDDRAAAKANRIIQTNYMERPCHFTPGAAIDVLHGHRARLEPRSIELLERYLHLNLPYMSTEDLKIHGYNDNHPHKAIHALIVGGEMLGDAHLVQLGLHKLRQAVDVFRATGFPCEYNSPNYTPVSLQPLASLADQARNEEARELALSLEHYYWRDLAVHFDARVGLPAGPFSRGYVNCYSGLFSGTLVLLMHLFPERFSLDLIAEIFERGETTPFLAGADAHDRSRLPFFQAHPIWYANATYHYSPAVETAIFSKRAGTTVRGTTESGTTTVAWTDPEMRPAEAPRVHHLGPRRSLITTYYGEGFNLGTSQFSWLNNSQAHGFYSTLTVGPAGRPDGAAAYYARMFFDENSPHGESPQPCYCFNDQGDLRTVQAENAALVCYNPLPYYGRFRRLRTGLFRPLAFSRPRALFVGERQLPHLNGYADRLAPVALDEGAVYIGIVPLRLTNLGQSRQAHFQAMTFGDHLSLLWSSFEGWQPQAFTYEQILSVCAGFVFEIHPASAFASFAAFRQWLAAGEVEDAYYVDMRTLVYRRAGLKLECCYSPYHHGFRHVRINGAALETPQYASPQLPEAWPA